MVMEEFTRESYRVLLDTMIKDAHTELAMELKAYKFSSFYVVTTSQARNLYRSGEHRSQEMTVTIE